MKRWLPNILTLGNLFCGLLASVVILVYRDFELTALLIAIALILDFFDGFLARILKVQSELGKQLDSLADMVSFGVVPGLIVFTWLVGIFEMDSPIYPGFHWSYYSEATTEIVGSLHHPYFAMIGFLITIFSAIRLAKFNIDTNQSDKFYGLPTPANTIFWMSLPLCGWSLPLWMVVALILVFSFLLVCELPLFALKFKTFKWADNKIRFLFLLTCLIMLICAVIIFNNIFVAFPIIIILYLVISIVNNQLLKRDAV